MGGGAQDGGIMGRKLPICKPTYPASCIPVGFDVVMEEMNRQDRATQLDRKGAVITKSQPDHQNDGQNTPRLDPALCPFVWDRHSV